ncbi:MAG: antitoxin [Bacteroidetes bacterium]|nr:MAG: antitoxin [Bacteroidota bacterium]
MNDYNKNDLIKYRLSKATETFSEVQNLVKLGYYNTAINRLYYSCFYAIIALLLNHDISATTHSGVRKMLGLHFISKNKISQESGKLFSELFDKRQKGDYNDFFDFDKSSVEKLILPTKTLIEEIKKNIILN